MDITLNTIAIGSVIGVVTALGAIFWQLHKVVAGYETNKQENGKAIKRLTESNERRKSENRDVRTSLQDDVIPRIETLEELVRQLTIREAHNIERRSEELEVFLSSQLAIIDTMLLGDKNPGTTIKDARANIQALLYRKQAPESKQRHEHD